MHSNNLEKKFQLKTPVKSKFTFWWIFPVEAYVVYDIVTRWDVLISFLALLSSSLRSGLCWGQLGHFGAPAVKIPARSHKRLSYGLWQASAQAAACSQREPSTSLTGQLDPLMAAYAQACIYLLHTSPYPLSMTLRGTLGSSCSAWTWLLCQAFLGLALVFPSLQEPLPAAKQAFESVAGSAHESHLNYGMSLNTNLDIPLQVSMKRDVSQSHNPDTITPF